MDQERRKDGRKALGGPLQGCLSLAVGGRKIRVESVVDVSPVGLSVLLQEDIAVGVPVEVGFRDDSIDMTWRGITVWSSRREFGQGSEAHPAVAIGIQLFGPSMLHTLLREQGEAEAEAESNPAGH
jgi:hypothetical protein